MGKASSFVQQTPTYLRHWKSPFGLLVLMAFAMPLAFSTWNVLLNNFVVEAAGFNGADIGVLQSIREIPGFLAIGVIAVLYLMREQSLALISLIMLGVAVALTAVFPSFQGLLLTTFLSSVGFHYYETVNQSLQLQWIEKDKAPEMIGWLVATGSAASLLAYLIIYFTTSTSETAYMAIYITAGGTTALLAIAAAFIFPHYKEKVPQAKKLILRKRYWLYYVLQFLSGARRQIFVVFAAFMMVEKFGLHVHEITAIFLVNFIANMIFAPIMGRIVGRFGERLALSLEYAGLVLVFLLYAGVYYFDWPAWVAITLYIIDHLFFALAFAIKTYFQKVADPEDIAPTMAVAFTINHIAAVTLPAPLGLLWLVSPMSVFGLAAFLALSSLLMALLIPRNPRKGHETFVFNTRVS